MKHEARFLAALAGLAALRLIAGALLPLSADEAYYWLWSRHLAAGYFDHPPAIAYVIRAGTLLFGSVPFGVRLGVFCCRSRRAGSSGARVRSWRATRRLARWRASSSISRR